MQTRFYIERRKDDSGTLILQERPVFMSVSFHGDRVMLSTGIKTDFHGWDPELQRLKSSYPGSYATNLWLDTLAETADKTWAAIREFPEDPDAERFRRKFQELKPRYSTGFFDVFYLFLESGSSRWSTSTYRKVRTIYKHLREFEDQSGTMISFRDLNGSFLEKFKVFYAEKGNSGSTTHQAVNIIVWFMNWATENGYNVNLDYRRFYKLMRQDQDVGVEIGKSRMHLYLQWDELLKISEFRGDTRKLERVRDLFCFMCFSGLRYSELQALRKEDVGEKEVVIRNSKGKPRRIPLNTHARKIHRIYENKYYLNNTAFPTMSIITMNKYLRMLGKEAGLNRMVMSEDGSYERVPLFELLTAGMAVHTFIANAIELEIPFEVISGFTGVQNDGRVRRIKMDLARKEISKFDPLTL
jgi:integrase